MELLYLYAAVTGIGVSALSTLFGLGGGIIMVPILGWITPLSHLEIIATSLTTIVLVSCYNTVNYHFQQLINWRIVPWIAVPSALFAFFSARLSAHLNERLLLLIFLLFLIFTAARTLMVSETVKNVQPKKNKKRIIPLGIGMVSGLIASATGIGGGGITTPLMLVTGLVRNIQAAPTSNAIMIFTSIAGSIGYAFTSFKSDAPFAVGYIHPQLSLMLFLGSLVFACFGYRLNKRISLFWRKTILSIILAILCVRIFFLVIR
jgi:uncharacterized membrane protein YfcA